MSKEEIKQWVRNQINSSLKIQSDNKNRFYLSYNNQYLRALKLSTITGKPVNEHNFSGGDLLFGFDTKNKRFWYYSNIWYYLHENYSAFSPDHFYVISEVLNEYKDYKGYKHW